MDKIKLLKIYFWVFGLLNIFVVSFTVPLVFGDLFLWHPRNIPTEMMMSVIYLAMGIIMIICAKFPENHKSFVDFLVLANTLHAIIMMVYAENIFHLIIDSASIGLMGIIPLFIYPWGIKNFLRQNDEQRSTNGDTPEKKETMIRYFSPIIATFVASAVATYATYSYNQRQVQLVHIEALDKYRSYINSEDYATREYGFFVFEELGYSKLVDKLAIARKDSASLNALLSSERSSSAENIKAREIADKIMRIAVSPEQKTIPSSVSTHDAGTSKEGWAYIGHYVDSKWKTRYFEIKIDANPESLVGKTLNVREETGALNVREGMPTFTGSFKSIIEALKPGSKAKILKIEEWSSSGYMWAQITYGT